jgi:ribose transport system ATP-binding protein
VSFVLELADIKKRFGPTVALDGVNLSLRKGEVHALVGENGAGKSTLMNILAGSLIPDSGSIKVEGKPYKPHSPLDARLNGIALIHQELSLCPHMSVAENILMGHEPSRMGWVEWDRLYKRCSEIIESFGHPQITPQRRVSDLPIAARQVIEICRAISAKANIILMDEPTSSLHREDVKRLFELIQRLKFQGISIIYISHFLEEVREIADQFTVLRDGRSVAAGSINTVTNQELISHMVGRSVENLFPDRNHSASSEILMKVKDLSAPPALKEASFELRRGEILGIAGLMGSGRTEMVRAIFGLDRPESGVIELCGKTLSARGGKPVMRLFQGLGYLSEDRKGEGLATSLSIADNLTLTRFGKCSMRGWLNLKRQADQTRSWINKLGIKARIPAQTVRTLSGGNQQKVAIGRLLYQDADILLLDEPTRGIDVGSKAQIYEVISRLASEKKAIVMVSSYLPELFGLCDRLAVMSRGRLSKAVPITEWTPEKVLQHAIGVEQSSEEDLVQI